MRTYHVITSSLLALCLGLVWARPASAVYPHVEFPELAHSSDVIFVGTVSAATPRFGINDRVIVTDVTFQVEAVVHVGDAVTADVAQQVTLTFAGGQIGDRGMSVSGVPTFTVGQSYVVFSRLDGQPYFNPLIGGAQGLFKVVSDAATGEGYPLTLGGLGITAVRDAKLEFSAKVDQVEQGVARLAPEEFVMAPPGQPVPGSADSVEALRSSGPAALLSLNQFIDEIQSALRQPPPSEPVLRGVWNATEARLDFESRSERRLIGAQHEDSPGRAMSAWTPVAPVIPSPADDTVAPASAPINRKIAAATVEPADDGETGAPLDDGTRAALCYCGTFNLFLTMEQVPTGWWEWGENNYAMALYNAFMDVYRFVADDGSYGNNNQNEFGGYPSNQDLINNYGQGWGSAIAVTWTFWSGCSCCTITQADVFFNPAYSFWQNFSDTFNQSSRVLYRPNVDHELGHSWGMQRGSCTEDYSYTQISVMHAYYNNIVEDGYGIHHPEAYSIRRTYQGQTGIIGRKDVGVESYYAAGSLVNSTVDSWYYIGDSITVSNITVENNSNVATAGVRLRFYLSPNNTISTGDYQMGSYWFWDSFSAETYSTGSYTTTVPNVPPGIYYLGAIVSTDGDAYNGDDLWYNNATYLASTVEIRIPPPANNFCFSAPAIGLGNTFGTTAGAGSDGAADCGSSASSPDVWYSFTAPCSGTLALDTCGSAYDTVLSVHSACTGTIGNQIDCNDDCVTLACGLRDSCLQVPVAIGANYIIRVSGYDGASGDFALNLSYAPPAHDACAAAPAVAEGGYAFSNCGATTDGPAEALCDYASDSQVGSDIWYQYVPSCTGDATVSLCGSAYDTRLAVYDACPDGGGAIISCVDDYCGYQSEITFAVAEGVPYLVRVGGYLGAWGEGIMNVSCAGTGVPAASLTGAVSRKPVVDLPECDVTLNLAGRVEDRTVTSEARQGGLTDLYLDFDVAPGGPGANHVTLFEQTGCPPGSQAAYAPYTGAAVITPTLVGNQLWLQFAPALEGRRTYALEIGPSVTSIPGQVLELRVLEGDINSDGKTNGGDRSVVVGLWTSQSYTCAADVNLSGTINGGDRSAIVGVWTSGANCAP